MKHKYFAESFFALEGRSFVTVRETLSEGDDRVILIQAEVQNPKDSSQFSRSGMRMLVSGIEKLIPVLQRAVKELKK